MTFLSGASSGIGAACARVFAGLGSDLVLASRQESKLSALAEDLLRGPAAPRILVERMDVSKPEEAEAAVRRTVERLGSIDILINNAGVGAIDLLVNFEAADEIAQVLDVNLEGVINLTRAVLPHMIFRRKGHVIQVGSIAAWIGTPTYTLYAASKFGLRGFSEALRREVSPWGVRVSSVYPGPVRTDFQSNASRMKRLGLAPPRWLTLTAEEVARGIGRLALRPRRTMFMPGVLAPAVWINQVLPGLLDRLVMVYWQRGTRKSDRP